jgi:hypothetical protein
VHEFWAFGVGVVFAECFNFRPLDFGAIFVEEPAFRLRSFTFFADETGFPALRINTDVFGDVSIGTIGLLFD